MASGRLDRWVSQTTELSRKEAGILIRRGEIRINDEVVKKAAAQIPDGAEVFWGEELLDIAPPIYLMMHKPAGLVCANRDGLYSTVIDLLPPEWSRDVHIVGRLDLDTTGLLLMTDDGDWSHRVSSPRRAVGKVYEVGLADPLVPSAEKAFAEGIKLDGEEKLTRPAVLQRKDDQQVTVTLFEGRYHQLKRMFAALGNKVEALHRSQIGQLHLDNNLKPGAWRELTPDEIELATKSLQGTDAD
jgi:16S rRNA pseudouridine516 synthase